MPLTSEAEMLIGYFGCCWQFGTELRLEAGGRSPARRSGYSNGRQKNIPVFFFRLTPCCYSFLFCSPKAPFSVPQNCGFEEFLYLNLQSTLLDPQCSFRQQCFRDHNLRTLPPVSAALIPPNVNANLSPRFSTESIEIAGRHVFGIAK